MNFAKLILLYATCLLCINVYAGDRLIDQMVSTYNLNQARFHAQYRGVEIQGTAVVTEINADFLGTGSRFYVHLLLNGSKVQCSTNNRDSAASLNKGDSVKFSGSVHDVIFERLIVTDCIFKDSSKLSNDNKKDFDNLSQVIQYEKLKTCPSKKIHKAAFNNFYIVSESGIAGVASWGNHRTGELIYYRFEPRMKKVLNGYIDTRTLNFDQENTCLLKSKITITYANETIACESKGDLVDCESDKLSKNSTESNIAAENILLESTVRNFYDALANANGELANEFIVEEKRNKGPYEISKINSFYKKMNQKLKVSKIEVKNENTVFVDYEYAIGEKKCNGNAEIKLRNSNNKKSLIEKIKANC